MFLDEGFEWTNNQGKMLSRASRMDLHLMWGFFFFFFYCSLDKKFVDIDRCETGAGEKIKRESERKSRG